MVPETLCVGPVQTNCYLLAGDLDPESVLVIDPGDEASRILSALGERRVEAVLLTHGHFDHTGALSAFEGKPILIGEKDAAMLSDPAFSSGVLIGDTAPRPAATRLLKGGESLSFPGFSRPVTVYAVPGHTPGGLCYRWEDLLFTGDTLFRGGWGRCDLAGGNEAELSASLKMLCRLTGPNRVYPGHGPATDLERERAFLGLA